MANECELKHKSRLEGGGACLIIIDPASSQKHSAVTRAVSKKYGRPRSEEIAAEGVDFPGIRCVTELIFIIPLGGPLVAMLMH